MFAPRYFAPRYFGARYYPPASDVVVIQEEEFRAVPTLPYRKRDRDKEVIDAVFAEFHEEPTQEQKDQAQELYDKAYIRKGRIVSPRDVVKAALDKRIQQELLRRKKQLLLRQRNEEAAFLVLLNL